ncbi:MAG: helix-turn-helix transcriptional regulator [Rhizomicrobium sp.]
MTELELCVLGTVWLRGPCSSYAIRREFAESPSSYWSSSSGSIYPVIKRLLAAKLIAKSRSSDKRGKRDIATTPAGARAVREWVASLPDWTGKAALDPIRTRMNFFGVLKTSREQLAFLRRAGENTELQLAVIRRMLRHAKPPEAEYFTALGTLSELEARIRWLAAVRKLLGGGKKSPNR